MHQARTLLFAQLFVALAFAQAPGVSFAADHAKTSAPAGTDPLLHYATAATALTARPNDEIGRAHV